LIPASSPDSPIEIFRSLTRRLVVGLMVFLLLVTIGVVLSGVGSQLRRTRPVAGLTAASAGAGVGASVRARGIVRRPGGAASRSLVRPTQTRSASL